MDVGQRNGVGLVVDGGIGGSISVITVDKFVVIELDERMEILFSPCMGNL